MRHTATVTLGSQVSLLGQAAEPQRAARSRVRAQGSEPDAVAVGTSPPGKTAQRRADRPNSRLGSLVGGHEIVARLGSGGTSVVYLARPTAAAGDATPCALKVMRRRFAADLEMTARFEREADFLGRVRHPGVPRIRARGITGDGVPFVAMDLLEGATLGQRLDQGPMAVAAVIDIAEQVADALAAVHAAGVVHCDLKPDNLFLVPDPERRSRHRAVVIDFGVAIAPPPPGRAQAPRRLIGTPSYMAPEQSVPDGVLDARTDVYGFGCLLHEMLCGDPPFGGNMAEILGAHQGEAPPRAGSLRPDTPGALERLILAMLAKDPARRPRDMAAVRAGLAQATAEAMARSALERRGRR
ncbi:MAG TPA: serine/threonine-protein kinase [Kofleriaceae bacterium]|nr:serine/threonine-protein kinase [Kofleriaceae bacterium]